MAFSLSTFPKAADSPVVLVRRGGCSFVQKVRNVEHAGGKMAIVVDEKDNESMDSIIMVDDGTGNGVKIPSVMVNEKQGEKLINWYEAGNDETRKRTQVVCTFDIVSTPSLTSVGQT